VAEATAHLRAGDPLLADRAAHSALKTLTALGSKQGMAESHQLLAEAAERQGGRAAEHWEQALRLYTEIGSSKAEGIARRLRAPDAGTEPPARDG